ncbi:hypothetical protein C2E23DRAFT_722302, partial [Lenzites betulinus]
MKTGEDRPLWASVADALYAKTVPKDTPLKERELRVNPFAQNWTPKMTALPEDLKAMVKVAKKYQLTFGGPAIGREVSRAMPMWAHVKVSEGEMKKVTKKSAALTCLRKNHRVSTVGECESLAKTRYARGHLRRATCTCTECERQVTESRCANPDRCYQKAARLLDVLPEKWDPRKRQPEDQEDEDWNWLKENSEDRTPFDVRTTVKGPMQNAIRMFVSESGCDGPANITEKLIRGGRLLTVATDGACLSNGAASAKAGAGVYVEENEELRRAVRVPATLPQTNQMAETIAMILAVMDADK